jgi:hypothetical protein
MSINPVSRSLLPFHGPLAAANSSPAARPVAPVDADPPTTATRETVTPAANSNDGQDEHAESTLERALRQARIATGAATSGESDAGSSRYAPAIGLYRRISQYSDDRSSTSGLLKSWNEIVRENQFEDAGVAGYVKAIAQNDAAALPSSVLHLTV